MKRSRARRAHITWFGLARTSFWFIFGGIWLLVGMPFVVIGIATGLDEQRFSTSAELVDGRVLRKVVDGKDGSGRKYMVHYRFTTDDGRDIVRTAEIALTQWQQLQEREAVAVRVLYKPNGAVKAHIEGESQWTGPVVFTGIGAFLSILGGSVFFREALRIRAQVRAAAPTRHLEWGKPARSPSLKRRQR